MSSAEPPATPPGEVHPEFEVQFSELEEGTLSAERSADVRSHLASCPACAAAHADFCRTLAALSGLNRVSAPPSLPADVASTIHRRSAGRFFGRRAFGDRVPFEVLAGLALVIGMLIYWLIRSSATGSFRLERERERPGTTAPAPEREVPSR